MRAVAYTESSSNPRNSKSRSKPLSAFIMLPRTIPEAFRKDR
jgi:hypothetical protein